MNLLAERAPIINEAYINMSQLHSTDFSGSDQQNGAFSFELNEEFEIPPEEEIKLDPIDPAILDQTRAFDDYCEYMQQRYPKEYKEHETRRSKLLELFQMGFKQF